MCMKEVVNKDRIIKSNLLGLQGTVDRGVVYLCIQAMLRFIKINFHSIIQRFLLKVKFTLMLMRCSSGYKKIISLKPTGILQYPKTCTIDQK